MNSLSVSEIYKYIRLQKGCPDFLTVNAIDMNGEIEFYLPLLCFHLEDDSLVDFIPYDDEKIYLFTAWIRADSDDKNSDLNPEFMYLDYMSAQSCESEHIDLDFDAENAILESIAEQCPDACGKTLMELLEECREKLCIPYNEKLDEKRK